MKELEVLLTCSENLLRHIQDEALFKSDRDQFIETLQELLKVRQKAIDGFEWMKIKAVSKPFIMNDEEKALGIKIAALDKEITDLLELRMMSHKDEWREATKKGKSASKYNKPFQMPLTNGAFLDSRK